MKTWLVLICSFFLCGWCLTGSQSIVTESAQEKTYSWLTLEESFVLPALLGVKSVVFNTAGTKLYALNLEGMSIFEYDRENRKLLKVFNFKPTEAQGWDYVLNVPQAASFAEKPVEACLSHGDKILWVSLHNAGGIVPILLDSVSSKNLKDSTTGLKVIYIRDLVKHSNDTLYVPLIRTGVMPKVIAKTANDKTLLVSNWGSKSLSVLSINDTVFPFAKKLATVKLGGVPRGIAIDEKHKKSYVAIYSDSRITTINNKNWKIEKNYRVPYNPRHLVLDSSGRLFVSFNLLSEIACFDTYTGKLLFKARSHQQPRTIALSKNRQFLFVTCYEGNKIDVFKINKDSFSRIYSIECKGKPVGISLYEDDDYLEAWICNYMAGNVKVLKFRKKFE